MPKSEYFNHRVELLNKPIIRNWGWYLNDKLSLILAICDECVFAGSTSLAEINKLLTSLVILSRVPSILSKFVFELNWGQNQIVDLRFDCATTLPSHIAF